MGVATTGEMGGRAASPVEYFRLWSGAAGAGAFARHYARADTSILPHGEGKGRAPDIIDNTGERIVAMAIGRQRSGGRGREKRK